MFKVILITLAGVAMILSGIYLMYLYIVSLNSNGNLVYLFGSFLLAGSGIFLLIKAGKSDRTVVAAMPPIKPLDGGEAAANDRLSKNNELLNDWKKVNQTKDKLRMIEVSTSSENS